VDCHAVIRITSCIATRCVATYFARAVTDVVVAADPKYASARTFSFADTGRICRRWTRCHWRVAGKILERFLFSDSFQPCTADCCQLLVEDDMVVDRTGREVGFAVIWIYFMVV
jgi:hypothetical protein